MSKKLTVRDRIKKMLGAKDDAELEAMLAGPDGDADPAEPAASGESPIVVHNHVHLNGESAPAVTTGDDPDPEMDDPTLGAVDEPEELPGYFLEHVAQNNARFDRLEAMLSQALGGDEDGDEPEETDGVDPEIEAEISGGDDEGDTPPDTSDDDPDEAEMSETGDEEPDEEEGAEDEEPEEIAAAKKTGDGKKKPAPKGGKKKKITGDSAALTDSYQDTVALAEVLVPGIKLPTFDAKAPARQTFDSLCKFRRHVLTRAYSGDEEMRGTIDAVNGGPLKLKSMSCGAVRVLFRAVGNMKRVANDSAIQVVHNGAGGGLGISSERKVKSPADLNRMHAEAYGAR